MQKGGGKNRWRGDSNQEQIVFEIREISMSGGNHFLHTKDGTDHDDKMGKADNGGK